MQLVATEGKYQNSQTTMATENHCPLRKWDLSREVEEWQNIDDALVC